MLGDRIYHATGGSYRLETTNTRLSKFRIPVSNRWLILIEKRGIINVVRKFARREGNMHVYAREVRFGKSTNGKKILAQGGATTLQLRLLLIHGRTI